MIKSVLNLRNGLGDTFQAKLTAQHFHGLKERRRILASARTATRIG